MEHPALTGFAVMLFWGIINGPIQWLIRKLFPGLGERLYRKRNFSLLWRRGARANAKQAASAHQHVTGKG